MDTSILSVVLIMFSMIRPQLNLQFVNLHKPDDNIELKILSKQVIELTAHSWYRGFIHYPYKPESNITSLLSVQTQTNMLRLVSRYTCTFLI